MAATDPYPDPEMSLLDQLQAASHKGDAVPLLVVEASESFNFAKPDPSRRPHPEMRWMESVPGIDAMVTVGVTLTFTDGSQLNGFAKVYARSGDLHQVWIRTDTGWDRLAKVHPEPTLRDWEYVAPFELDPEWFDY